MIEDIITEFKKIYHHQSYNVYFAPGRVNLIGEHTDYNGGHVLPCALDIGTYLVVGRREDQFLKFYSENFKELGIVESCLDDLILREKDNWANYPKGVIKVLKDMGFRIDCGLDFYFIGNIPNGAGLSSSASIEVVTALMLSDQFNLNLDQLTLVKLTQKAENTFMGVHCGIMDQFAIGMGKENQTMLLDTNTLNYTYVPIKISGYSLVVANTNKRRGLSGSKYNERRRECEKALKILQKELNIQTFGDLSIAEFNQYQLLITDDMLKRRAKHAVYENQRTLRAQSALQMGDLVLFGKLMNESHISLRDDYEVTGVELDTLVSLAWKEDGVIGSRMTGAGFGGCTISIVHHNYIESFKKHIEEEYSSQIGYKPTFYVVHISDGAKKMM